MIVLPLAGVLAPYDARRRDSVARGPKQVRSRCCACRGGWCEGASCAGCQRAMERRPRQAITDRVLAAERIESTDAAEPIDRTDAKDPTLPAERAEPTLPIDSTESLDAMHRTLPGDLMLRRLRRSDIG